MTAREILTAPEATEAAAVYRRREIEMRRQAKWAYLRNDRDEGARLMELAHSVGMEFVRNHIGSHPDRWEKAGTVVP